MSMFGKRPGGGRGAGFGAGQPRAAEPRAAEPRAAEPRSGSASASAAIVERGAPGPAKPASPPDLAPSRPQAAARPPAPPAPKPAPAPARPSAAEVARDEASARAAARVSASKGVSAKATSEFYETKTKVFAALMSAMDVDRIAELERAEAENEITDIVNDIVSVQRLSISTTEQTRLAREICDDILGYGPLEPLLARDDIADIMVNGSNQVFIETNGKIEDTGIRFRDNQQLLEICQRMVSKVGRRVDESSPICDARLLDGSRVNVIAPPLAIDGSALTIRKFKKDKLKIADLIKFGSLSPEAAQVVSIAAAVRCNILISGGTGSGKTTLLNCLSACAGDDERIITCEDSAELQLQQPHVVRLETRPPNIEGKGEITMRALVKNCLRMRPERIIVGEVRGPEAFDLLQAMNTGHDGSMGTLHANTPREALSRVESMVTMGGFALPTKTIREMAASAIHVIVQAQRLRDGSRRITHITEVMGMEGDTIILQDLVRYEIQGEDANGKLIGKHVGCGVAQPRFWERARSYNRHRELTDALARLDDGEH